MDQLLEPGRSSRVRDAIVRVVTGRGAGAPFPAHFPNCDHQKVRHRFLRLIATQRAVACEPLEQVGDLIVRRVAFTLRSFARVSGGSGSSTASAANSPTSAAKSALHFAPFLVPLAKHL
ncbi:hypothetical protein [Actinomadura sp. NPDC000929]|uniref:hypothetical protein n=1 Tax=Actinomadura sp. NPDC000929 TaxID=3154517 RepID=UPI00339AFFCB